jgi:NitT/TauT family transport system permease protein
LSVVAGVLLWGAASQAQHSVLFPSPFAIVSAEYHLIVSGELLRDSAISLMRIAVGFVLGCGLGIPLGLAMGLFPVVRIFLDPLVQFLRFVPPIAWLIPAIMWFGIGETSKIIIIFYMTVFLVLLNTMAGVASVRKNQMRSARCFGANPWQQFAWIVFPATMPFIVAGARIAMGNSFAAVVGAELIAANAGLGYLIVDSGQWTAMANMFAAMLTLGVLGIVVDKLFELASGHYLQRYLEVTHG